jgi:alkanesulfonate monooxygenase SsuD/methylene tetrahydromethanopterin reductase-like flavin-dependent oxidoreductase (luciferase family)
VRDRIDTEAVREVVRPSAYGAGMKTAISIPPFTDTASLVALGVEAEQAGWDGVFYWDHLVWLTQLRQDVHDPWVLLGAVAARTERVRLGTMVTPLARRRPWVLAKHLTTLDHLSDGRAVLGVGLGEPSDADFAAFGDSGDPRERAALLDEGLQVLDGLLRGPVVHRGPRFQVEAELRPRPVQQPRPPVWVAAVAPNQRPLARAIRWDGVVPLGPDKVLTPQELSDYLSSVERPPMWEVVAARAPGVGADEYVDAGVTWLVDGTWPDEGWVEELQTRVRNGPR